MLGSSPRLGIKPKSTGPDDEKGAMEVAPMEPPKRLVPFEKPSDPRELAKDLDFFKRKYCKHLGLSLFFFFDFFSCFPFFADFFPLVVFLLFFSFLRTLR